MSAPFTNFMKDNSFDRAMNKIVGQHEAEQKAELRARRRADMFSRVRAVIIFLFFAAILVVTYNFRDQLVGMIGPKPMSDAVTGTESGTNGSGNNTPQGQTVSVVNTAKQNAATRDAIIDQVSK